MTASLLQARTNTFESCKHLQAWMATLETNGVSAGRRRYACVVLRTALNTAIRWRLITMNAATLIDAPRTTSREIRPLNPDEARALLDACRDGRPRFPSRGCVS